MKKLMLLAIMLIPLSVFAQGGITVTPATIEVEVGKTKTFQIVAENTVGDVTIESSNTEVATVDKSTWETGTVSAGETVRGTITVTGKAVGTSLVTLTIDAATFDEEELKGQTKTVSVTVVEAKAEEKKDEEKKNPKTGAFLDVTVILIGAAAVYATFNYVNKKRTMI